MSQDKHIHIHLHAGKVVDRKAKDASIEVGMKVKLPNGLGMGVVKKVNRNIASVSYTTSGGSARQEDFHVTKLFNSAGQAFSAARDSTKDGEEIIRRALLELNSEKLRLYNLFTKIEKQQDLSVTVSTGDLRQQEQLLKSVKELQAAYDLVKGK